MKCSLEDSGPPCKRCRQTNIECLFEKPQRESALSSDAGLEYVLNLPNNKIFTRRRGMLIDIRLRHRRIKGVEDRVRGVEEKMVNMVNGLQGVQATLHEFIIAFRQNNPQGSPVHNGSTASHDTQRLPTHSPVDSRRPPPPQGYMPVTHTGDAQPTPSSSASFENPYSPSGTQSHGPYPPSSHSASSQQHPSFHPGFPSLPPISPASANVMPPPRFPTSLPPIRSHIMEFQSNVRTSQPPSYGVPRPGSSRANNSSNVTSADSSDDEGASELPGAGLVAPLEVLRGLGEEHELRAVSPVVSSCVMTIN